MSRKTKLFYCLFFLIFCCPVFSVLAAENISFDDGGVCAAAIPDAATSTIPAVKPAPVGAEKSIFKLNKETAARGYKFEVFGGKFKLSLLPGALADETVIEADLITEESPTPWKLERVSQVYQFSLKPGTLYDNKKPINLEITYDGASDGYRRIFFYDKNYQSWRELPTIDYADKKMARASIFLPFARVAVFSDPLIKTVGTASWYSYKKGNFAASVDFPKGSRLRVYNLANNKFVDIVVNDFGPERQKHPDRILDLDKVAFKKIASVGAGLINIRIQPLYVAPDVRGRVFGVSERGAMVEPDIKADAAIVFDEKTGETVWEKNSAAVLPLASLSKLAAIKVFFDQRPSLNAIVAYQKQDELYNYQYCRPEESAKLTVKDGETMTVGDLVYAALVGSANNAVESLVRVSGLKRNDFIAKMNEFAASVGAEGTRFVEPTGLSSENVSTAKEYASLSAAIFKNPIIQKISTTPKYKFVTINTKKLHVFSNTNNFIRDGAFAAANNLKVTGSKTGYLDKYNLMTRAEGPNGESLIAVNFGANTKIQSLEETKELIQYGIRQLE
jgi:D-alanyl-D-alanine carboxypeptidase